VMQQFQKDFMAILTPAQRTQYEKLMKEQMENFRRNGGPGGDANKGGKTGGKKGGGGGGL